MHVYDTLIIGCGYFSYGFALARGNCVICEENQICDNHFYLPLKGYRYHEYLPKTEEGKLLLESFSSLGLISGGMQNTNGFECAFCKFITEHRERILLKCRAVKTERKDGIYDVTVHTNEGLSHLYAKNVIHTQHRGKNPYFTVLFTTDCAKDTEKVEVAFPDGCIEKAFYEGRYALHLPARGYDENSIKLFVYQRWCDLALTAKILYMAPIFSEKIARDALCDDSYENPVEAFEAGYFYAKGMVK